MVVLAHISDLHIDGSAPSAERVARVARYLGGLNTPVNGLLVTGDVADHGLPAEYAVARELLAGAGCPAFWCPGNHDRRSAFRAGLLDEPAGDRPINQLRDCGGISLLLCDSTIPGRDDGYLADETISWLDDTLAGLPAGQPALACFHHPPSTLGGQLPERLRQHGEQRLADTLARHPRVLAVLCGHAHTPAAGTFAGRPLLVGPGVASTGRLPCEPGEWVDRSAPPAVTFHLLDAERQLTSHHRVVLA